MQNYKMRKSLIFGMVGSAAFLILFWGGVVYAFSGCSVKVLTFGNESVKEHQDYIIGVKIDEYPEVN